MKIAIAFIVTVLVLCVAFFAVAGVMGMQNERTVFEEIGSWGGAISDLQNAYDKTIGTEEPGTEMPGTEEPGTEMPGTEEPGTEMPGTEEPGTETPTEQHGINITGLELPFTYLTERKGINIIAPIASCANLQKITIKVKAGNSEVSGLMKISCGNENGYTVFEDEKINGNSEELFSYVVDIEDFGNQNISVTYWDSDNIDNQIITINFIFR